MRAPIHTIGYQERTHEQLVALLRDNGVTAVLDVRQSPRSRRPGFSSARLAEAFAGAGIGYQHLPFVGNPKEFRTSGVAHAEIIRSYARWIDEHPELVEAVDRVIKPLQDGGQVVCLLCYERHPGDCHRSILAERWRRLTGGDVEHIGTSGARRFSRTP